MKLSLWKHLTWKKCFLLAFILARRISELHGLSYKVKYMKGWQVVYIYFCSDFVAKTQNPSTFDPQFVEFTVSSLDDFVVVQR